MTKRSEDSNPSPTASLANRRTQRRISVRIPIQVFLPKLTEPITAMNQDISWGGAQFVVAVPLASLTGTLRLMFPWRGHEKVAIDAEVVRAQRLGSGHHQVAVRFASLSPRSQARLEKLLKMLDAADDSTVRDAGALVRELEVVVEDAAAMREMLEQIAAGRLSITVFEAYEAGQSIRLAIRGADGLPGLRLRARVREVERVNVDGFAQSELFGLELGFEHPTPAIKTFVDLLIEQLPPVWKDPESSFAGAPDWLRAMHFARPTEDLVLDDHSDTSVLESRFPDALRSLRMVWGDPEAFDLAFQDLTLGSRVEPGGWPEDAWDELGFLQDVHDCAYGLPATRLSQLRPTRCR
ncbi:PilZ domain-containing protein [Thiocapsa roseopersicina]|uniref:PilZ domain-containing protein n=1 Tax=Thiocapsa roseopersicina TaxID=1058 RepID=A0A1H2VQC3_THIRO|nr:PilZ domain-containing protein [Thiocapsa roseopersicina]SDW70468.1 PilZ domain-containing protein [Thiocapsa roseopersicina]